MKPRLRSIKINVLLATLRQENWAQKSKSSRTPDLEHSNGLARVCPLTPQKYSTKVLKSHCSKCGLLSGFKYGKENWGEVSLDEVK